MRIRTKRDEMSKDVPEGSAKIYQFPVRGRFAAGHRDETKSDARSQRVATVASSSWYHDAAIEESKRAHEH